MEKTGFLAQSFVVASDKNPNVIVSKKTDPSDPKFNPAGLCVDLSTKPFLVLIPGSLP